MASALESDIGDTALGEEMSSCFQSWKNSTSFVWPFAHAIDVKMDGSVPEKNSPFKTLGLTFPSKLVWSSYIISIAETALK